jgi:thiol-disulfide isomerase/thioredoxin
VQPTAASLEGKVVLLDFWAVWCSPCIRTFPHLRRWHEQYAEQGLVIVGLTDYHGYGWDSVAEHSVYRSGLSHDEERAAMVRFAEHHRLGHAIGFLAENSTLPQEYGVAAIPHVVLLDRQGKVRLIQDNGAARWKRRDRRAAVRPRRRRFRACRPATLISH